VIYLHKLLPLLVSPLGVIAFLLFVNFWLKKRSLTFFTLILLLIFSLPLTARLIWQGLEKDYPYLEVHSLKTHDAVIVLSGMLHQFEAKGAMQAQWGDPDRFFAGLEILRQGKAKNIIFTGGKMPWTNARAEGEVLRDIALIMGVSDEKIKLSGYASNTAAEASEVAELMNENNFNSAVLVTSSFHMPRAMQLFEKAGISVEAYPTDFKVSGTAVDWLDYIPSADGFRDASSGIREYIGRLYYQMKL
jgi:uncharacterized SAM-binding protein YcdF (DUF218 family)